MKTCKRTHGSHASLSIIHLRLPAPLVDLLLDGFSLLVRDNAPGIAITSLQELADALTSQQRGAALQGELHQQEVPLG